MCGGGGRIWGTCVMCVCLSVCLCACLCLSEWRMVNEVHLNRKTVNIRTEKWWRSICQVNFVDNAKTMPITLAWKSQTRSRTRNLGNFWLLYEKVCGKVCSAHCQLITDHFRLSRLPYITIIIEEDMTLWEVSMFWADMTYARICIMHDETNHRVGASLVSQLRKRS